MSRPLLAAAVALPVYSALAHLLLRTGGRRVAWAVGMALVVAVVLWGASRVGTHNPISRTARWDPLLFFVMGSALAVGPAAAATWGVLVAAERTPSALLAVLAGIAAGLAASPVAFVLAIAVEVLWPH